MTDLAVFLLARIAEDEAVVARFVEHYGRADNADEGGLDWWGEYAHLSIAPARVLTECEAKRRIVQYAAGNIPADDRNPRGSHGIEVLKLLALPYADHPDYLPEWRL